MSKVREFHFGCRRGQMLPVLRRVPGLPRPEQQAVAGELRERHAELVERDGQTIVLRTRLASVPGPVRVRIAVLRDQPRCPSLRLTLLPSESVVPLVRALRQVLGAAIRESPAEQQEAAASVLVELTELARNDPTEFGRRLLAGYLLRQKLQALPVDLSAGRRYALVERPLVGGGV